MKIRIGSRESRLAVIQSEMVQHWLEETIPGAEVSIVTMKTTGDLILDRPLAQVGGKGLFVKELDRALLDAVEQEGKDSPVEVLRLWSAEFVAAADIRIAVRAVWAGKNRTFLERALAPCRRLNVSGLCAAALSGAEAVYSFLGAEGYGEAAEALKESDTAFERWCDNRVIRTIRSQKYRAFSAGPLAAYVLARENEIKTVRMILTGKQNGLPDQAIRERVREMYV